MRFVALVSGGKDSIYSALECIRNGHELVACIHLGRPDSVLEESYMYQTAASEVVRTLVEDCLGVPLLLHQRVGTSVNTSLVYDDGDATSKDEVEDLYVALQKAKERFDSVEAISSGAILSTYQRVRIENVCSRLGLTSLSYLWRLAPQKDLLQQMLHDGIEAVIVRAACPPGLVPRKHLNKTLRFLWDTGLLERLHQRYQFHVCGEGGEYESLVLDSPLHQKKLVLDEVEIVESDDGVGDLKISTCHAEDKTEEDIAIIWTPSDGIKVHPTVESTSGAQNQDDEFRPLTIPASPISLVHLPHVKYSTGGLFHVTEIMAPMAAVSAKAEASEAELAVQEAREIFSVLKKTLERNGSSARDVLFVHLYLSEISHFANINAHYQAFFGTILPPSRSCVAVGNGVLPGGRRILLDCLVQAGSGEYMRSKSDHAVTASPYASAALVTKTSKLREVLHVQSISHWAPVCVGPYSQVNTLRTGLHFMAGQIGLVPATMELHPTWQLQLNQCWKNVAAVLDALDGGSMKNHLFSGMIYVSHSVYDEEGALSFIKSSSQSIIKENGGLAAGRIDGVTDPSELYGGYEDEETWKEMRDQREEISVENDQMTCPILVVSIPEMPKCASVEVEVIAATKIAVKNLDISSTQVSTTCSAPETTNSTGWGTGHDFPVSNTKVHQDIRIDAAIRVLGRQNAAVALVFSSVPNGEGDKHVEPVEMLSDMLSVLRKVLADGRTGLMPSDVVHLRLFHTATKRSSSGMIEARDDGVQIRCALQTAVAKWGNEASLPATSVIPVHAIDVIGVKDKVGTIQVALQALLLDPVHLETDIWIHKDREYAN